MATKIYRKPKAKPLELKVSFGKYEGDIDLFYTNGEGGPRKADCRLLCHFFEEVKGSDDKTLREELISRGYDITTLNFSIMIKPPQPGGRRGDGFILC